MSLPPLAVSDIGANINELIASTAEFLSKSRYRKIIFTKIYTGKKAVKTVESLMESTGLVRNRVLDAGKSLADHHIVKQVKIDKKTAYEKVGFYQTNKSKILRLAENPESLKRLPTKRNAHFIGRSMDVNVKFHIRPERVNIKLVTVDDIDSFAEVKIIPRSSEFIRIPERNFKDGIGKILGEIVEFNDWGGEISDLYSSNLIIDGKRKTVAFAFKGPGTKGSLTPGKFGKNGDQIQRLVESPAEVYVIQYWMDIKESVISQFEKLLSFKSQILQRQFWYAVIDGYDSARLIKAYPELFRIPEE